MTEYIYIIENAVTGKFYIGRTNKPAMRKRGHFSELRRGVHGNPRLQASFNKHGESVFEFKVVDSAPAEKICAKEAEWFAAFDEDRAYLYNCHFKTHGGPITCKPHTESAKKKISEAIKEGTRGYVFGILDEGYETKAGLNVLARKHAVGGTTLLRYKSEWEQLRGVVYGHPQADASRERVRVFAEAFKARGEAVARNIKDYKVSHKALVKYLPEFGLSMNDIKVDGWKRDAVDRARQAAQLVKETGCSVLHALRQCGASVTTYYKYV